MSSINAVIIEPKSFMGSRDREFVCEAQRMTNCHTGWFNVRWPYHSHNDCSLPASPVMIQMVSLYKNFQSTLFVLGWKHNQKKKHVLIVSFGCFDNLSIIFQNWFFFVCLFFKSSDPSRGHRVLIDHRIIWWPSVAERILLWNWSHAWSSEDIKKLKVQTEVVPDFQGHWEGAKWQHPHPSSTMDKKYCSTL